MVACSDIVLYSVFADVERERACGEVASAGLVESVPDLTDLLAGHHHNNNNSPAPAAPAPSVAGSLPGTPAPAAAQNAYMPEGEYSKPLLQEEIGNKICAKLVLYIAEKS